jgi:hypothetical protein
MRGERQDRSKCRHRTEIFGLFLRSDRTEGVGGDLQLPCKSTLVETPTSVWTRWRTEEFPPLQGIEIRSFRWQLITLLRYQRLGQSKLYKLVLGSYIIHIAQQIMFTRVGDYLFPPFRHTHTQKITYKRNACCVFMSLLKPYTVSFQRANFLFLLNPHLTGFLHSDDRKVSM